MDLHSMHVESLWLWGQLLYWPLLAWVIFHAPWRIVIENDARNAWLATCVVVMLMWQIKLDIVDGLSFHQLGTTILTLMFRWQFAVMSQALVLIGVTFYSDADWAAFGVNALLTGVLPISFSYMVWRLMERHLPANYFIYIFLGAFLTAGLSIVLVGLVSYFVLSLSMPTFHTAPLMQYHQIFLLLMFPEAFLTGLTMTALVVYRPQWVATFNDKKYLSD